MPITLSAISKKSKKQEDAKRTYKSNLNGPGPQPPSPESDATTTDNEETSQPLESAPAVAIAAADASKPKPKSKPSSKRISNLSERLEVNQLLAELYPSKHINQKVAALEKLSELVTAAPATEEGPKRKTRARKNDTTPEINTTNTTNSTSTNITSTNSTSTNITSTNSTSTNSTSTNSTNPSADLTEDPIAKAILDSAFKTPPSSPPKTPNAPNAPSRVKKQKAAPANPPKQKQNYNIIIHVEPSDVSKRLDFENKVSPTDASAKSQTQTQTQSKIQIQSKTQSKLKTKVEENSEDDDDEYVPGCSEDDNESWDTYDESDEYDEDDEYDDDDDESYYSSSSESGSDDADDAAEMEELDKQQQRFTEEMTMLQSLRATYEDLLNKDKNNRIVAKQLKTLKASEEKIKLELEELTHTQKRKNSKRFRKLLRRKSSTNDLEYFKTRLTLSEQRAMIAEMNAVAQVTEIAKPYKLTLLESDIPRDMKAVAIRKIGMLQYMEPGCGEYCKLKNWVDAFMQIPFNRNKNLPITIADGVDKCHEFMTAAKTRLDQAVYGLNDAKMQIMQMVGQWIANPAAIGTAVAIHGPPGTGKTSLVKEGISKILGRDFAFIALGGATDSSFLEGHSYTYEGSMWGKIVDILIRCKSSNPVIYFDELDKISETSKGEEIVGILTHLTDTSQNSQFHDKYFSEVAFDLSKCLFIFSYNDESRVNPVLLDRMYKIRTTGYGAKDKTFIAQHHLIPRICSEVAFAEGDIVIPDKVVEHIVEHHTHKEAGVRNLKRGLETIYTKLNLHRLMRPGTQLFEDKDKSFDVSFPYTVTCDVVDKLIKKNNSDGPNINLYL